MKSDLWGEHRRISDRFGILANTQKTTAVLWQTAICGGLPVGKRGKQS